MRLTRAALVVASVAVATLAFGAVPAVAGPAGQVRAATAEAAPSSGAAQPSGRAQPSRRTQPRVSPPRETGSADATESNEDGSVDSTAPDASDVDASATEPVSPPGAEVAGSTPLPTAAEVPTTPGPAVPGATVGSAPVPPPPPAPATPAPATPAPPPGSPSTPEPHVITTFADQLRGGPTPVSGRGLRSVPVRPDIDGCDRDYGTVAQCIPKALPGGQGDLCRYLAQRGIKGVKVRGADRQQLDRNRNGVVCD